MDKLICCSTPGSKSMSKAEQEDLTRKASFKAAKQKGASNTLQQSITTFSFPDLENNVAGQPQNGHVADANRTGPTHLADKLPSQIPENSRNQLVAYIQTIAIRILRDINPKQNKASPNTQKEIDAVTMLIINNLDDLLESALAKKVRVTIAATACGFLALGETVVNLAFLPSQTELARSLVGPSSALAQLFLAILPTLDLLKKRNLLAIVRNYSPKLTLLLICELCGASICLSLSFVKARSEKIQSTFHWPSMPFLVAPATGITLFGLFISDIIQRYHNGDLALRRADITARSATKLIINLGISVINGWSTFLLMLTSTSEIIDNIWTKSIFQVASYYIITSLGTLALFVFSLFNLDSPIEAIMNNLSAQHFLLMPDIGVPFALAYSFQPFSFLLESTNNNQPIANSNSSLTQTYTDSYHISMHMCINLIIWFSLMKCISIFPSVDSKHTKTKQVAGLFFIDFCILNSIVQAIGYSNTTSNETLKNIFFTCSFIISQSPILQGLGKTFKLDGSLPGLCSVLAGLYGSLPGLYDSLPGLCGVLGFCKPSTQGPSGRQYSQIPAGPAVPTRI